MAVDGHQRSVPTGMRPRADQVLTGRGGAATRTTAPADGKRRRSVPKSPGPTVSAGWTPSPSGCWNAGYGPAGYGPEGYGSPGYAPEGYGYPGSGRGAYDGADPGYGVTPGYGYQQPAMDDYGYGDPGYSDPSYDGPRGGYGGYALPGGNGGGRVPGSVSADGAGYGRPSGHHVLGFREPSRPEFGYPQGHPASPASARGGYPLGGDQYAYPLGGADEIYPVTGAQEALPATSAQQVYPLGGTGEVYPLGGEQQSYPLGGTGEIYPVTGAQEAPPATGPQPRADTRAAADAGFPPAATMSMPTFTVARTISGHGGSRLDSPAASDPRLAGMRYDELRYEDPPFGESGFDEPLDDDSSVEELRRSAPSYPRQSGGPSGTDQRPADLQRRADPRPSGYGQESGFPQPPAPDRTPGYGQPSRGRGGLGPQMGTARDARPSGPSGPPDLAVSGASYLGAPASGVGLLTPPGIRRLDLPADDRPPGRRGRRPAAGPAGPAGPRPGRTGDHVILADSAPGR